MQILTSTGVCRTHTVYTLSGMGAYNLIKLRHKSAALLHTHTHAHKRASTPITASAVAKMTTLVCRPPHRPTAAHRSVIVSSRGAAAQEKSVHRDLFPHTHVRSHAPWPFVHLIYVLPRFAQGTLISSNKCHRIEAYKSHAHSAS